MSLPVSVMPRPIALVLPAATEPSIVPELVIDAAADGRSSPRRGDRAADAVGVDRPDRAGVLVRLTKAIHVDAVAVVALAVADVVAVASDDTVVDDGHRLLWR